MPSCAALAPAASIYPFSWPTRLFLGAARIMWMLPSHLVLAVTLRALFTQSEKVNQTFMQQFAIGVKEFRFRNGRVFPSVYPDSELRQLRVPTLLLIGANESI